MNVNPVGCFAACQLCHTLCMDCSDCDQATLCCNTQASLSWCLIPTLLAEGGTESSGRSPRNFPVSHHVVQPVHGTLKVGTPLWLRTVPFCTVLELWFLAGVAHSPIKTSMTARDRTIPRSPYPLNNITAHCAGLSGPTLHCMYLGWRTGGGVSANQRAHTKFNEREP